MDGRFDHATADCLGIDRCDRGHANLAPFSFFNGVGANPPTIMFCPANRRDGSPKDTLKNIERTGQFVVNLVTEAVVEAMNLTAAD